MTDTVQQQLHEFKKPYYITVINAGTIELIRERPIVKIKSEFTDWILSAMVSLQDCRRGLLTQKKLLMSTKHDKGTAEEMEGAEVLKLLEMSTENCISEFGNVGAILLTSILNCQWVETQEDFDGLFKLRDIFNRLTKLILWFQIRLREIEASTETEGHIVGDCFMQGINEKGGELSLLKIANELYNTLVSCFEVHTAIGIEKLNFNSTFGNLDVLNQSVEFVYEGEEEKAPPCFTKLTGFFAKNLVKMLVAFTKKR